MAEQKAETPPARDPKVEARAAIEQVLRRYEAAWEALDFNALTRVWAMTDPKAVQAAMAGMREYSMEVKIQQVEVAPDGQSGTAVAVVSYRYRPAIGSSQRQTQTRRYTFTRRGDTWMITGLT